MLGKLSHQEPQLTREEVEKRLESRQISFGIEKAPMMLPMEIFSHDNSNQDRYYAVKVTSTFMQQLLPQLIMVACSSQV